ncbi:hypothetical protein NMY22_g9306 [Coprinellus aureogranulatus]|nr:hypothetical protein NMY22_g9306 [Coprinellus aureogranulatus]
MLPTLTNSRGGVTVSSLSVPAGSSQEFFSPFPVRLTNACLSLKQDADARGRGCLGFAEKGRAPASISSFYRCVYEQDMLDIELKPGKTYVFSSLGPFSIEVVGYYPPVTFEFRATTAVGFVPTVEKSASQAEQAVTTSTTQAVGTTAIGGEIMASEGVLNDATAKVNNTGGQNLAKDSLVKGKGLARVEVQKRGASEVADMRVTGNGDGRSLPALAVVGKVTATVTTLGRCIKNAGSIDGTSTDDIKLGGAALKETSIGEAGTMPTVGEVTTEDDIVEETTPEGTAAGGATHHAGVNENSATFKGPNEELELKETPAGGFFGEAKSAEGDAMEKALDLKGVGGAGEGRLPLGSTGKRSATRTVAVKAANKEWTPSEASTTGKGLFALDYKRNNPQAKVNEFEKAWRACLNKQVYYQRADALRAEKAKEKASKKTDAGK